jgi:hypothetical protein
MSLAIGSKRFINLDAEGDAQRAGVMEAGWNDGLVGTSSAN